MVASSPMTFFTSVWEINVTMLLFDPLWAQTLISYTVFECSKKHGFAVFCLFLFLICCILWINYSWSLQCV